jgi:hypothetical protein
VTFVESAGALAAPAVLIEQGLPVLVPQLHRSPGWHVSFILNDLCQRLGHYTADRALPTVKMELGSALEHALAHRLALQYPGRYFRRWDADARRWDNGLELCCDEIYGTLDLLDMQDWAIEDVKCTWLSAAHDQDSTKLWKFWMQAKCYCWMLGEDEARERYAWARLRLVYPRGDYKTGDAEASLWQRRCAAAELESCWSVILKHRDRMIKEGITPERMAA